MSTVQVCLDAPELMPPLQAGTLHRRGGRAGELTSFAYSEQWLEQAQGFLLDPRLGLFPGEQFPAADTAGFGIFLDSAPDRWGRLLLDRREVLAARDEARPARALTDWDYLLGVQDECRMGALRFRKPDDGDYLAADPLPVPPVARLAELEAISLALEQDAAEDMPDYRQWLSALMAPGTSLGGARPKANYRATDHSLWIAKFPSRQDRHDVAAWEHLLYGLARECGIDTAPCRLHRFAGNYHSFCVRRFDRDAQGQRRLFVSAMTLLEHRDGEGGSYLELAEFIQNHGAQDHIEADLEQLFRRLLFNLLCGNTDDHLRNHGFIRHPSGWQLAPAYDLNPSPGRRHHALAVSEAGDLPDLAAVLKTASYYRLSAPAADALLAAVRSSARQWRDAARQTGLGSAEIGRMEAAFELAG